MRNPGDGSVESLALVEFFRCSSAKLGSPNDEVFEGHPLSGKGLDGYTAQRVMNSKWLAELEAINRVHRCYDPALWRKMFMSIEDVLETHRLLMKTNGTISSLR